LNQILQNAVGNKQLAQSLNIAEWLTKTTIIDRIHALNILQNLHIFAFNFVYSVHLLRLNSIY